MAYGTDVTRWREAAIVRDGLSLPRDDYEIMLQHWREYWRHADARGYHPALADIRPEDDDDPWETLAPC